MSALKAVWKNGQVVLSGLIVQEDRLPAVEFMTEADQNDDPIAIQQWIDELRATPAVPSESAPDTD
jgi:type IV secretory pathway TrbF-like protein